MACTHFRCELVISISNIGNCVKVNFIERVKRASMEKGKQGHLEKIKYYLGPENKATKK